MHYAEKELLVFKAFKNILFSHSNITKITVSDIAKEAGIGKGTIYEYFSSKEEIIAKSLVYNFYEVVNELSSQISEKNSFEKNCYILFDFLIGKVTTLSPYFKLFNNNFKLKDFYGYIQDDSQLINALKEDVYSTTYKILSIGVKEGIIRENDDVDYQLFVIRSACSGISNSICDNNYSVSPNEIKSYKKFAYELIIRALK